MVRTGRNPETEKEKRRRLARQAAIPAKKKHIRPEGAGGGAGPVDDMKMREINLDDDDFDMDMGDSFDSAPPVVDPVPVIVDRDWDAFVLSLPALPTPSPPRAVPVVAIPVVTRAVLVSPPPPPPPRAVPVVPVPLYTDMGPAPRAPKNQKVLWGVIMLIGR